MTSHVRFFITGRKSIPFISLLFGLILWSMTVCVRSVYTQEDTEDKVRIAVMNQSDFVPHNMERKRTVMSNSAGFPDELASRILTNLSESNRFIPLERKTIRRVVLEQKFGQKMGENYKEKTLKKALSAMSEVSGGTVRATGQLARHTDFIKQMRDIGSSMNADYLVVGDLDRLDRSVRQVDVPYTEQKAQGEVVNAAMRLRILNVSEGRVIGAENINTKLSEKWVSNPSDSTGLYEMYDKLAAKATKAILDIVFPAKLVKTDPLAISRGRNSRIESGVTFEVFRQGEPIKDEGHVIGHVRENVGKVRTKRVEENVSFVEPVEGKSFQKGDLVRQVDDTSDQAASSDGKGSKEQAPGLSDKPRIAVRLIKKESTASDTPDHEATTGLFTDTLITRLSKTKRFRVLDRQEVDQLIDEQTATALAENRKLQGPMGQLDGADYLIFGNLAAFSIKVRETSPPRSSRTIRERVGTVRGNMRIVNANSGKVQASESVRVEETMKPNKRTDVLKSVLADRYAEKVVSSLMKNAFPIKVAAVDGETIYVNRGRDGGLSAGDRLNIMKPGEDIVDPDTGVKLGQKKTEIGTVKLTEVDEAKSKARLIDGKKPERGFHLEQTGDADRTHTSSGSEKQNVQERGESGLKKQVATLVIGQITRNNGGDSRMLSGGDLDRFISKLAGNLASTNRFKVLDRQRLDEILAEQEFNALVSGENPTDKLRQLTEAEYIVNGQISRFSVEEKTEKNEFTGETETNRVGMASGTIRLVDVRTGEIVKAGSVSVEKELENDRPRTNEQELLDAFTSRWVRKTLDQIFPPRIIGQAKQKVYYVDRGSSAGMKSGMVYDLMRPGEKLSGAKNDDVSFGRARTKIGQAKVMKVDRSRSRIKLLSGDRPEKGDILTNPRSAEEVEDQQNNQKTKNYDSW